MNAMRKKWLVSAALCLGLSLAAGAASAGGTTCDPKTQKCDGTPCSPGFYKNHIDYWWGIYCDANGNCAQLLTALTCKGSDASCGRSAAASYLNQQSGCTEKD